MILFLAESNDDTFQLGIGLSSSDLDLVRDGRPIGASLKDVNADIPDGKRIEGFLIVLGNNETDITATFCERGFFGPETEIIHSKDSL
jgi:hypothetical protein